MDVEEEEQANEFPEIMLYEERLLSFGEKGLWFEVGSAARQNVYRIFYFFA